MKNIPFFLFALTAPLSFNQFISQCDSGTLKVPAVMASMSVKSSGGKLATAEVRCWKEKNGHFAMSQLMIGGKIVYATPDKALQSSCGSAAGEIFRPFAWSLDGQYLAWIFVPYCADTEPIPPVVMLYSLKENKNFAPKFTGIEKDFFKRYPKMVPYKKEIEFVALPIQWMTGNKLLLEIGALCYDCVDKTSGENLNIPITQWTLTPDEKIAFVAEKQ